MFSDLVIDTLVKCGWIVNWAKSSFEPSKREEFIGYQVSTASVCLLVAFSCLSPDGSSWLMLLPDRSIRVL